MQTYYALRSGTTVRGERRRLHALLLNPKKGIQVDHIDHNGLNNQRENLRACTNAENSCNQRKRRSASKYKGVYHDRRALARPWQASIKYNYRRIFLGYYVSEEAAAFAYNAAAKKYHGRFARLNEITSAS